MTRKRSISSFNPRTHEECDGQTAMSSTSANVFQSTHSRGVRLALYLRRTDHAGFNPRTHEECDTISQTIKFLDYVSIHALTRSATWILPLLPPKLIQFQSTHSRGVRRFDLSKKVAFTAFQSTHSRGVRLYTGLQPFYVPRGFNPRTHEECDKSTQRME